MRRGGAELLSGLRPRFEWLDTRAQHLDRIVVDDTGLSGKYDFVVEWTPTATEGTPDPSLVKALEDQLGLTLEAKDAVIPVVVVDHADQPASD